MRKYSFSGVTKEISEDILFFTKCPCGGHYRKISVVGVDEECNLCGCTPGEKIKKG